MSTSQASTPLIAWQRLRAGSEQPRGPVNIHTGAPADERPTAAVFRCADSGVAPEIVFGQNGGSLVDLSTLGHAVDSGVMGGLEYAVDVLDVPLIVVLGHHGCGAMREAMRAWNDVDLPKGSTRMMVEQAIGSIVRRGAVADSPESVGAAHIVETGLSLLERSPVIAGGVEAGTCGIVCATTTDRPDGRIRVYATVGAVGEVADSLMECV